MNEFGERRKKSLRLRNEEKTPRGINGVFGGFEREEQRKKMTRASSV